MVNPRTMYSLINWLRPLRPNKDYPYSQDPKLVTMTLRESSHWPTRNSNVPEWCTAAKVLRAEGYSVVIIRDTSQAHCALEELDCTKLGVDDEGREWSRWDKVDMEIIIHTIAAYDLDVRAALYSSAAVNLFVNNGPAWFAMALDAPMCMLRVNCENAGALTSKHHLALNGIPTGGQLAKGITYQRLVWEDDTAENIVAAARQFMSDNPCHQVLDTGRS